MPFNGQRACRPQSLEAMMELQPGEKEEFLTEIYKALASISTLREKARGLVAGHCVSPHFRRA